MYEDLAGRRFGRLLVMDYAGRKNNATLWRVWCECGAKKIVRASDLRSGRSNSCGCLRSEKMRAEKTTHGKSHTPTWNVWNAMIRRCVDPGAAHYECYGGRGISVCERWLKFENFLADMGEVPEPGCSIDRFPDNNGNYEPGNCRWATVIQQARNRRNNHLLTFEGRTMPIAAWAEELGIRRSMIDGRLRRGWSDELALKKN